ncbi:hypothetical protein ABN763_11150 [Spongiivirga sp. MCCC 1A20706]|uniref:hypothetical protein n=1 Tax=Spongiivirga sp. MCCC 1A20706 TaxID=3160963 RepID=UPI0039775B27
MKALNHEANKSYWRQKEEDADNFWSAVKDLKPQFLDLHIEDQFFSWSGDNSVEARTEAANRLLDLFLRVYKNWTDQEVMLHLIGHSHGGNVINQFTRIIGENASFPEKWRVKSIVYLSTPFFQKEHQLAHTYLHDDCKILNVYNEYDITQRFIASFSLKNLEILIGNFNKKSIQEKIVKFKKVDFKAFEHLTDIAINNKTEGPFLWRETNKLLDCIKEVFCEISDYIETFDASSVLTDKSELILLINRISSWATERSKIFAVNSKNRKGGYGRSEYFEDIDLLATLKFLNEIFHVKTGPIDSYFLGMLSKIITNKSSGITDKIDPTDWSPQRQVNGAFELINVPITEEDDYFLRGKKANYDSFITGLESCIRSSKEDLIPDILMRLFSQFILPQDIQAILSKIWWVEFYFRGKKDTELKKIRKSLKVYKKLIAEYNQNLILNEDKKIKEIFNQPGSIPYLAMTSHSLSHTQLWDEVQDNLKESFVSGKNPGYKE